jgi:hypothetical protein
MIHDLSKVDSLSLCSLVSVSSDKLIIRFLTVFMLGCINIFVWIIIWIFFIIVCRCRTWDITLNSIYSLLPVISIWYYWYRTTHWERLAAALNLNLSFFIFYLILPRLSSFVFIISFRIIIEIIIVGSRTLTIFDSFWFFLYSSLNRSGSLSSAYLSWTPANWSLVRNKSRFGSCVSEFKLFHALSNHMIV